MSNKVMLIILFFALSASVLVFTGCQSSGLANTCKRFGMDTSTVTVYAVDSETLGDSKTVTKFNCIPRKYKDK